MITNDPFFQKLKKIHSLSKQINGCSKEKHSEKIIGMIKEHAVEIEHLKTLKDPHFLTETGDLMILCMELLEEHNISIDKTLEKCIKRFEKKLTSF